MKSNNDKLKGLLNESAGDLKEKAGKATGNKDLENEGTIQKTKGQAQKLSGAIQDTAQKAQTLLGIKSKS